MTSTVSERIAAVTPAARGPRDVAAPQPAGLLAAGAFEALVCVRTGPGTSPQQFVSYLAGEPTAVQVWMVAADIDVIVRLACPSLSALETVVARMRHQGGAEQTVTHLVLPQGPEPAG
jgi:hypothetical protein